MGKEEKTETYENRPFINYCGLFHGYRITSH